MKRKARFIELADLLEQEFALLPTGAPAITLNELIVRFGVSFSTAKRILLELQQRGVIVSRIGAGSFVAPPRRKRLIAIVFDLRRELVSQDMFNEKFLVRALIHCNMAHANYTVTALDFEDFARDYDQLESVLPQLKGVILLRSITPYVAMTAALMKRGIPCAFYGSSAHAKDLAGLDYFVYNEQKIIEMALAELKRSGKKRPGFVGDLDFSVYRKRLAHFREAAAHYGMSYSADRVLDSEKTDWGNRRLLRTYLSGCDSIIAVDDREGLRVRYLADDFGFRVPEELAIVGINDRPHLNVIRPSFTTISLDSDNDTAAMIDRMIQRIECDDGFRQETTQTLFRRNSC